MEVIAIIIMTSMNNHIYTFGGRLRLQRGNGSIGDRATGIIAQFVMIWWERAFMRKMNDAKIEVDLLERFIDDINIICDKVHPGADYVEDALFINKDKEKENEGKPDDMTTMEVVRKVANEVNDMIKLL